MLLLKQGEACAGVGGVGGHRIRWEGLIPTSPLQIRKWSLVKKEENMKDLCRLRLSTTLLYALLTLLNLKEGQVLSLFGNSRVNKLRSNFLGLLLFKLYSDSNILLHLLFFPTFYRPIPLNNSFYSSFLFFETRSLYVTLAGSITLCRPGWL